LERRIVMAARPFPPVLRLLTLIWAVLGLGACQGSAEAPSGQAAPTTAAIFETKVETATPSSVIVDESDTAVTLPAVDATPRITIDAAAQPIPIDRHVLGTNLPAWLGRDITEDATFIARTIASGVTLIRIPGGSWSNGYNWLACETGADISGDTEACWSWPWGLRPTDFINFINATGTEAMYTVNLNGTAQEAAALVAFFNGTVDDDGVIGVDIRGRDWGKVSDWAQLRSDNGNPAPLPIRYWEIGNEIYGGNGDSGTDCVSWGWEETWTCDGREYVNGIGQGEDRHEGFLEFRAAMQLVDPTIQVGAVGVPLQRDWSEWGLEVIEEAGAALDFYVVHHYAYFDPPPTLAAILTQPQQIWLPIMDEVNDAFSKVGNGRTPPIAITEYNLFSVIDKDNEQLMKQAVNMLYIADSIGQMMQSGVSMANQWNLANVADSSNGTDYGLMDGDTRYPQYYAFPLWSRFGDQMLPVATNLPADTNLSAYAGLVDGKMISILVINKTDTAVAPEIQIDGLEVVQGIVSADVIQASSLDSENVTVNGLVEPANDFSNAPSIISIEFSDPLFYTFEPYSITLLQINLDE
jgi:alpha-L-arabinofuranosidase